MNDLKFCDNNAGILTLDKGKPIMVIWDYEFLKYNTKSYSELQSIAEKELQRCGCDVKLTYPALEYIESDEVLAEFADLISTVI